MAESSVAKLLEDSIFLSRTYLDILVENLEKFTKLVNNQLSNLQPIFIVAGSIVAYIVVSDLSSYLIRAYKNASIGNIVKVIRGLPLVRGIYEAKLDKIATELKHDLNKVYNDEPYLAKLPDAGSSSEILLKKVNHYLMFDSTFWQQGRISGAVYTSMLKDYSELLVKVYGSNMWSNPLHSDVFAGVRKMEAEIIRMVASMYLGDPERITGSMTSGGTESIVMACKAYRDYAIKVTGVSGRPEIVAPVTAHAAFEKAANMLNCKIVHIPVDKKTFKVDLSKMEAAINGNTCMLVGSAPQFPHGIVDPIRKIAKLGERYSIPVHVDACLGGFLLPFMEAAGFPLDEQFDFRLPGVTSISADTHKYGYAPKGTSVILYRDKKYIHQQYSIQTDWPGGIYASPTLPGSRPGGLIATCWTAMMYHGYKGYVGATERIIGTTRHLKDELSKINGIEVLGDPQVSVIAITSNHFNIFQLNDNLTKLGWNLNALQFPSAIHLCVTLLHANDQVASSFIRDVSENAKKLLGEASKSGTKQSDSGGSAAIYGMAQTVPDRSIVADICTHYLDGCLGH